MRTDAPSYESFASPKRQLSALRAHPCCVTAEIRYSDRVRTVTATEASRSFAALLDAAERGQTVVVTRGGRRIAAIGPASASNGAEFVALLTSEAADDDFAADVLAARDAIALEAPAWPAD